MLTIGQKLENGIESLIALSSEIADLQCNYDKARNDLSMYNSLIEIQKYLGSGTELYELLPSIEDVIIGVFGTNWCKIVIHDNDIKKIPVDTDLSLIKLNALELDNFILDHQKARELFGIDQGKLIVIRMNLVNDNYGYLILYWSYSLNITDNSLRFLKLLKSQLEISIQNAQLLNKFKIMSIRDPLTGVYNRAYFNHFISTSKPTAGDSVIMFDLDNFKKVNDTKGHAYGDTILAEFAAVLVENCWKDDLAIRYGGEEFIVTCFGGHDAVKLADSIRQSFSQKTSYTVSAGIANFVGSDEGLSYELLCERADFAMYLSKQQGKDRTTVFQPS